MTKNHKKQTKERNALAKAAFTAKKNKAVAVSKRVAPKVVVPRSVLALAAQLRANQKKQNKSGKLIDAINAYKKQMKKTNETKNPLLSLAKALAKKNKAKASAPKNQTKKIKSGLGRKVAKGLNKKARAKALKQNKKLEERFRQKVRERYSSATELHTV